MFQHSKHASALSLLFCMVASVSFATEIDSFSLRSPDMEDATIELNDMMQMYINDAVNEANAASRCNEDNFREIFHERVGGVFWTVLENDIPENSRIDARTIDITESIFQDFCFVEAPALSMARLGYLMRMRDYYIGSDKLGHFLEEGHTYYQDMRHGETIEQAIAHGEQQEAGYFGLHTTGVYSYADLVANMEGGLNFWSNLVSDNSKNKQAYVVCKNGKYFINRPFDWFEYVNAAWDEGINCNRYRTEDMAQKVSMIIQNLEMTMNTKLSCPIKPEECPSMIERYGRLSTRVITPECFK